MVKNGYVILLPKNTTITEYIDKLRIELKSKALDIAFSLIAKDVEKLWDAKFINLLEYETSILDLAIKMVNERLTAISNNLFSDGRYDLRSTINIVEMDDNQFYCLFTSNNKELKEYFETIPEIKSYKYYADKILEDITEEENEKRGLFWHSKYETANWNTSFLGLSAQLTTQPDILSVTISPDDIKEFYRDKEVRMDEYIKSRIVIDKVAQFIGAVPIDKISPDILEDYFRQGYDFLNSDEGIKAYNSIKEKIGAAFTNVDSSLIVLN